MQKTASKNSIPSGSYEFFKSGSQYNYYTSANFKHADIYSENFEFSKVSKMPFRSRDMINLPLSQIYRQAKLLFNPEKGAVTVIELQNPGTHV